ncbi:tetratricopeptide (TPR) repeat protein [Kribbella aluminosa]|uniref:Tetratricopeptide (TPR) repeat protein n=1 Tax=Kribbella aluminosa TaxID=416017 RepID=A0ABS4URM9_9ACTN|nr:tetratricopeptide repeat protein [Kribbella aluminosa]MBP2354305.1 tetratricopeptide (TPR) repeat protein [Kribbella aluminosa]
MNLGGSGEPHGLEADQVVSAIERACESDLRTALRLVARYSAYWWSHGLQDEAAAAAERVLSMLGRTVPVGLDEEYLLAVIHGAASAEQEQVELAQQIVLTTTGPFQYSVTVLLWSLVFGPFEPAAVVDEVLERNESGDAWTRAAVELCRGYPGLTTPGPPGEAAQALRTALGRFRMLEDRWGMFLALSALRQVVDEPLDVTTEALELAEHLCLTEETALLLCERADLYRRLGKLEDAHADYSRALSIGESADLLETVAAARIGLGRAARGSGNLPAARAHLSAVLTIPELPDAHFEALHELAALNASEASA